MNNFIDTYFNDYRNVLDNFLEFNENKLNLNKCVEILKNTKWRVFSNCRPHGNRFYKKCRA